MDCCRRLLWGSRSVQIRFWYECERRNGPYFNGFKPGSHDHHEPETHSCCISGGTRVSGFHTRPHCSIFYEDWDYQRNDEYRRVFPDLIKTLPTQLGISVKLGGLARFCFLRYVSQPASRNLTSIKAECFGRSNLNAPRSSYSPRACMHKAIKW